MDFETIYLTYKDDVYRFLYKLCHGQADLADDLTQETFLKVYLNIDKFRGDSQFKTWLFAIAKRAFLTSLRKNRVAEVDVDLFEVWDERANQVSQLEKRELLADSLEVVFSLPEPMKLVVIARLYTEAPYETIAKDLGISLSSAKVLFHRARKLIKKRLKEDYGHDL